MRAIPRLIQVELFLERLLIEKRQDLEQRLSRTQQYIKHKDGPPNPDFAEQATERQDEELIAKAYSRAAAQKPGLVARAIEEIHFRAD